jgi:hypothetical protein
VILVDDNDRDIGCFSVPVHSAKDESVSERAANQQDEDALIGKDPFRFPKTQLEECLNHGSPILQGDA